MQEQIRKIEDSILTFLREDGEDDFHDYSPGVYYPHMLGRCLRRYWYYYTTGEKPELSTRSLNFVTVGRIAHVMIQSALQRIGYDIEKEFTLDLNGFKLRGRADAVGYHPYRHVVEIKTVSDFPQQVFREHALQVHVYMKAFSASEAVLIYVRRRDFQRRYYTITFDDALWKTALKWFSSLHKSLESGKPPDPTPSGRFECESCPLRNHCPAYPRSLEQWF